MNSFVVAKYLRLSSEDDDLKHMGRGESNSIQNQRNLLDTFIQNNPELAGNKIIEFCDDGWSGKNFERPAIQQLLSKVRQGEIHCIIVKDISRFGRDYLTVGNYISRIFPFLGVRFIAVNDGFDSIRPMDIDSLETSFKTILYDLYSRDISKKVRNSNRFRAQRGDFLSPFAPYGYIKNPNNKKQLIIDPEAAKTVRRIFQMIENDQTTQQIAKTLNQEAVPTPMLHKRAAGCSRTVWPSIHKENFWTQSLVVRILRDERYTGRIVYGKQTRDMVGHIHTVKVNKTDWIIVDDTHEGIVTQEQFNRVQASLRTLIRRDGFPKHPLCKKVRCRICGYAMARINSKHPYYLCKTSSITDAFPCTENRLPESDLMSVLLTGLHMQAQLAVELCHLWEAQRENKKFNIAAKIKKLAALKESHSQLTQQIKDLYEKYALGNISKEKYFTEKATAIEQRDSLSVQIGELEAELMNTSQDGKLNNRFVSSFQNDTEITEITREIATDVIEEVLVNPGGRFEIVWNCQDDFERLLKEVDIQDIREKES